MVVVRFQYKRATSANSLETALEGFTAGAVVPADLAFFSHPFTTSVSASSPTSSFEKCFSRSQNSNLFSSQNFFTVQSRTTLV